MEYSTSNFYKGLQIVIRGIPYEIVYLHYHKPGKGASVVRAKIKNLITKLIIPQTFRSGETFQKADVEQKLSQFLYKDNKQCFFLDLQNFEQFQIISEDILDKIKFLKKKNIVTICFFCEQPIDLILPNHIALMVTECSPGNKRDTVNNVTKKAVLETGLICNVPLFININDIIKIDTRSCTYIGKEKYIKSIK